MPRTAPEPPPVPGPPPLVLTGGRVHSPTDPGATALVVAGDRVTFVGSDRAARAVASGAPEVDLHGALVTPAFVDAHVHATATGLALTGLDLTGVPSLDAALDRVRAAAAAQPDGVLLGTGWDETGWPGGRPPTAAEVDRAAPGRLVYLARADVHSAVVSPSLLARVPDAAGRAGWSADGVVRWDAHHVLRAAAYAALGAGQRREAQRAARGAAAARGIGCLHEMAGPEVSGEDDLAGLLALAADEPGPAVVGYWGELGDVDTPRRLGLTGAGGDLFVDGAIGSRTACLRESYADDPGNTGRLRWDEHDVARHVVACVETGLQAGFHVIGDAALDAVLGGLRRAGEQVGAARVAAGRHRLEHVEMVDGAAGAAEIARWGLVASVQPAFDATWGGPDGMYARRLGPARAATLNPFSLLAAAGVPLALGSDSPVTPLDPWGGVRAAVHHRTRGYGLSARAAFAAATRGGHRAARDIDPSAGVLVAGAPATLAVWRSGPLAVRAPDDRVAAWSTDPRAGVPGLPDLTPGAALPEWLATVVRGRRRRARPSTSLEVHLRSRVDRLTAHLRVRPGRSAGCHPSGPCASARITPRGADTPPAG